MNFKHLFYFVGSAAALKKYLYSLLKLYYVDNGGC